MLSSLLVVMIIQPKKVVEEKFGRPTNPLTVIYVLSLRTVELSFLKN